MMIYKFSNSAEKLGFVLVIQKFNNAKEALAEAEQIKDNMLKELGIKLEVDKTYNITDDNELIEID